MSSEGSRASRLTQDRAEMLVTGLPSCTTSRLALVSFPDQWRQRRQGLSPGRIKAKCTKTKVYGLPTCGHVKEKGEDTAAVITCPEQPARGIKGQGEDAACQFTGATFHFLACGDVHDMHIVLGIPHLWVEYIHYHSDPSSPLSLAQWDFGRYTRR